MIYNLNWCSLSMLCSNGKFINKFNYYTKYNLFAFQAVNMAASIGRGKALKNRKLEAPRPKRQSSVSSGNVSQTSSESES